LAGLGYIAGVSIENMEILEAPTLAGPVADIRALYENEALVTVTTIAGAIALVFYALFAVSLVRLMREREARAAPGASWRSSEGSAARC
jgi:hypothetical protein